MPKTLAERLGPDSVAEFRAAARQRFTDASALAAAGRRTASLYFLGYSAEMTLKWAYFRGEGFSEGQPTTKSDLHAAMKAGEPFLISWAPSWLHNIRAWAELLVATRASSPSGGYPSTIERRVQRCGQRFEPLWRETLRYHKNIAYRHEVEQAREAAGWLLAHTLEL